jgi:ribosomal-protein-alanine N-acetyltransferase
MDFEIRTFRSEDLDQVMAIEKVSFSDPYDESFFWLLKLVALEGFIVAKKEKIVGYAISEIREGKGHIISMAVSPNYRRAGIGEALLRESIKRLGPKVREIYLEVRPGNDTAIKLYEKLSFRRTAVVRKRYYHDGEDALVMARSVESADGLGVAEGRLPRTRLSCGSRLDRKEPHSRASGGFLQPRL